MVWLHGVRDFVRPLPAVAAEALEPDALPFRRNDDVTRCDAAQFAHQTPPVLLVHRAFGDYVGTGPETAPREFRRATPQDMKPVRPAFVVLTGQRQWKSVFGCVRSKHHRQRPKARDLGLWHPYRAATRPVERRPAGSVASADEAHAGGRARVMSFGGSGDEGSGVLNMHLAEAGDVVPEYPERIAPGQVLESDRLRERARIRHEDLVAHSSAAFPEGALPPLGIVHEPHPEHLAHFARLEEAAEVRLTEVPAARIHAAIGTRERRSGFSANRLEGRRARVAP